MNNPFDLTGKTFLVTGASSGIGYETCLAISRQGGKFIAIARRSDLLIKLINETNQNNLQFTLDLSNIESIKDLVELLPNIDGIVHCAGVVSLAPLKFYSEELMNSIRAVNFDSIVYLINQIVKKRN